MLGTSRQSINKELKALEARKFIALRYGRAVVLDKAAIAQAANQKA